MKKQWHELLDGILDRGAVREIFLLEENCPRPEEYSFLTPEQYAKDGLCLKCGDGGLRVNWAKRDGEPIACVSCPDCGGHEIPITQLRQWKIDMPLFLEKLAAAFGLNFSLKPLVPKMLWQLGQKDGIEYYFLVYFDYFKPAPVVSELLKSPKSVVLTINEMYADILGPYLTQPCLSLKDVASMNRDGTIVADISEQLKVAFPEASVPAFEFRKKGQMWVVRYEGRETFLKDNDGPGYVAMLLPKPGRSLFAIDMHRIAAGYDPTTTVRPESGDDLTDRQTVREAEEQSQKLLAELDQARRDGDRMVEQEILDEIEKLANYLCETKGFGGKSKKTTNSADSIRRSLQQLIKSTIQEIDKELPECANHFRKSISTGLAICYDPSKKLEWSL